MVVQVRDASLITWENGLKAVVQRGTSGSATVRQMMLGSAAAADVGDFAGAGDLSGFEPLVVVTTIATATPSLQISNNKQHLRLTHATPVLTLEPQSTIAYPDNFRAWGTSVNALVIDGATGVTVNGVSGGSVAVSPESANAAFSIVRVSSDVWSIGIPGSFSIAGLPVATDIASAEFAILQGGVLKRVDSTVVTPAEDPISPTLWADIFPTSQVDDIIDRDFIRDWFKFSGFTSASGQLATTWTPTASHLTFIGVVHSTFNLTLTIATTNMPADVIIPLEIRFRRSATPGIGAPAIATSASVIAAPSWTMPTLGEDSGDQIKIPAVWDGLRIIVGTITGGIEKAND